MKIGYDAKRLFRNFTGLGNYSRTLVANFKSQYPQEEIELFAEKTSENEAALEFLSDQYRIIQPAPGNKTMWRQRGVCRDIKHREIDIFHGLSHELPRGIRRTGARSIVTIHDVCYRTFPEMFSWIERLIYSIKYPHALKNADAIIAISQSTKDDIIRFFPKINPQKIEVLYQAINPEFYTKMDKTEARKIADKHGVAPKFALYVGSLNSRKNLLGVIQAMGKLPPEEQLELVVVGNGSGKYAQKCMAEAEKLGILHLIKRIEGMSSMRALHALYTLCEVMLYPSFAEGFGLPVTEAILSGCPVVTSNLSSLPEAGGTYAHYIDPTKVTEIAAALQKILKTDPQKITEICEKARTEALQKFDPKQLSSQLHNLYTQTLEKK